MTLTQPEVEKLLKDVKDIKEALLPDPYDPNKKGAINDIAKNKEDIKILKNTRWKVNAAFLGIGGAGGAGLGAKSSVILAKLATLLGL